MEINRARPTESERLISDEALRQARAFTQSEPICFSFNATCCGKLRQNCGLVDPGYYLNGGPNCQQSRMECEDPSDIDMEAMADGLLPGCIVYAPKSKNQFWPAIVDFCPYENSHFVIFRTGGALCCTPYAYYLSFIPDWSGEIFGGWYTVDTIVPFDTLVNKHVELEVDFNDPHFDSAFERANKYYAQDLNDRLKRFSIVYRALETKSRRVRSLKSPGKSIRERVSTQARKFSHEIARRLTGNYQRMPGPENISLGSMDASSPASSPEPPPRQRFAALLRKKLSLTPKVSARRIPENNERFGKLTLGELIQDGDHVHRLKEFVPPRPGTSDARKNAARKLKFYNPTEHARCAVNEPMKRTVIQALMRSGIQEIRTYKDDEAEVEL